jgi:hypothetical protein
VQYIGTVLVLNFFAYTMHMVCLGRLLTYYGLRTGPSCLLRPALSCYYYIKLSIAKAEALPQKTLDKKATLAASCDSGNRVYADAAKCCQAYGVRSAVHSQSYKAIAIALSSSPAQGATRALHCDTAAPRATPRRARSPEPGAGRALAVAALWLFRLQYIRVSV